MSASPNLKLPYLDLNQNQKSVTHNAALTVLDALVNLRVASTTLQAPPPSPLDGQCWIVASGGTGAWTGKDLNVAAWQDGAWSFYAPNPGFVAYVDALQGALMWNGTAWVSLLGAITSLALSTLGIGTPADPANPLSAKLNTALFAALPTTGSPAGTGDLRVKLSKQAATNAASLVFQDNFSGRAEIGLTGDDNLHVRVSPDGTTFTDAMVVAAQGGGVSFASSPTAPTPAPGTTSTQLATTAFVMGQGFVTSTGAAAAAPVASVAGRTGAISLGVADVAGAAPLASPAFSGAPTAPTAAAGTTSNQLATTSFVAASFVTYAYAGSTYATAANATLTGTPTAPTQAQNNNSTRLATTAYADRAAAAGNLTRTQVNDAAYTIQPSDRVVAIVALTAPRSLTLPAAAAYPQGATLTIVDESGACSALAALTVTRAGTDTIGGGASATIATAYGYLALESNGANKWTVIDAPAPVTSVAGRTGAVTLAVSDVAGAAPLASPAFTGQPSAPMISLTTPGASSGLQLAGPAGSGGHLYDDGNTHIEAAAVLQVNHDTAASTTINAGGGTLYIGKSPSAGAMQVNCNASFAGTISGSGVITSNNLLLQGDNANAYVRANNPNSSLYLGAGGNNAFQLTGSGLAFFGNAITVQAGTSVFTNGSMAAGGEFLRLQPNDFGTNAPYLYIKPASNAVWHFGLWNGSTNYGTLDFQAPYVNVTGALNAAGMTSVGVVGTAVTNVAARAPGTAQGQTVGYSFYPSAIFGNSDYGPRRAVDLIGGFTAGWGTEYLAFNVGDNGTPNDPQAVTVERMRITGSGAVGIGTTLPTGTLHVASNSSAALKISNADGVSDVLTLSGNNTVATATPSLRSDGLNLVLNAAVNGGLYLNFDVSPSSVFVNGPFSSNNLVRVGQFTVATLPAGSNGSLVFVSNGRKVGEASGAGTGVLAVYSNSSWRRLSDDSAVAA